MESPLPAVADVLVLYRDAARSAFRSVVRSPAYIVGTIAAYVAFARLTRVLVVSLPQPFGGLLAGLLAAALLSLFVTWTRNVAGGQKLTFRRLVEFDNEVFLSVLNVLFLYWLLDLVLGLVDRDGTTSVLLKGAVCYLLFNVVQEVVANEPSPRTHAFERSVYFLQANWIEWFVPLVVTAGLPALLVVSGPVNWCAEVFTGEPLLPSYSMSRPLAGLVGASAMAVAPALGVVVYPLALAAVLCLVAVFRLDLFRALDGTSRRTRAFRRRTR